MRFRRVAIEPSGFAVRQSFSISQKTGGMKKTRPKNMVAWWAAAEQDHAFQTRSNRTLGICGTPVLQHQPENGRNEKDEAEKHGRVVGRSRCARQRSEERRVGKECRS